MKVVKVYGALKERLGGQGTFELDVFNAVEAIKALCANFPGLDKWLVDSGNDGIVYKVLLGETEVGEDKDGKHNLENLFLPWSEKEVFHITPVLAGSGGGFGRFMIGALMVGAVLATGGLAGGAIAFSGGFGGATVLGMSIGSMVGTMGVALMLGGISQMLTPVPKAPPEANKLQSFSFSGIQQTSQQGGAIPIVYGKCFVGSAVLSAGLDTFDA
tara:strand:+ start:2488 stop:3132 length:645 start_codon:yes stop_codon:yes gene_type:complete